MSRRPIIFVPGRFSTTSSALRYEAVVGARALMEAVFEAGGEPLLALPVAPRGRADENEIEKRLRMADALLLPGGGDLAGQWAGQPEHSSLYDVDLEQDAFDLAAGRIALARGVPVLAVCRGLQVINVALGGNLQQDLAAVAGDHRHRRHDVVPLDGSALARIIGAGTLDISCFHHQAIQQLGTGLRVVARADDDVVEAVELSSGTSWFLGVQWHPEDTAAGDPRQARILQAFVATASASLAQWG